MFNYINIGDCVTDSYLPTMESGTVVIGIGVEGDPLSDLDNFLDHFGERFSSVERLPEEVNWGYWHDEEERHEHVLQPVILTVK